MIFKNRMPTSLSDYRFYSVLMPLVKKEEELHLLYEVRSDTLKIQPGEICFPGGRVEEGESPKECAIRESCEELNISPEQIKYIAQLDYIHTYSGFTMYPFLGTIDYDVVKGMKVNQDEVKEIFLVPLSFLLETEPEIYTFDVLPKGIESFPYEKINRKDYKWRKGKSVVPIYQYKNRHIWGLTARITHHVIKILKEEIGRGLKQ
ncbi:MAG: CoA pyrophosphatase [Parabacteroides sp.]|nr:CoA pyrophosphatase [Parabacteroides sp.]